MHPDNKDILPALAQLKLEEKDWAAVQKIADTLKKIGDGTSISQNLEALVLLNQGKVDQGLEALKAASESSQNAAQSTRDLVIAYFRTGRLTDAEEILQTRLNADPKNGDTLLPLGQLRVLQDRPQEAEVVFRGLMGDPSMGAAPYSGTCQSLCVRVSYPEATGGNPEGGPERSSPRMSN